jgi:glycosyltransferase involved in cell wall biosynthesis
MISIITVVKNAESTIEETILSVINQKYSSYEYIIIDGGSTDSTISIIQKYSKYISYFVSEPDKGIYDAMNKGISISKGEWLYFLGSDDIFFNDNVLNNVFLNKEYNDFDVIYGNVLMKQSQLIFDGEFDLLKHFHKSVCQQAIFYRKVVFNLERFNIKYITTADYVFNINHLSKNYNKWVYLTDTIAIYNESGASFQKRDESYYSDNFLLRFDAFKKIIPNKYLARLIFRPYINYFKSHDSKHSLYLLFLFLKEVGFLNIIYSLFIRYKFGNDKIK